MHGKKLESVNIEDALIVQRRLNIVFGKFFFVGGGTAWLFPESALLRVLS
jgi:hypothetical protein